MEQTSSERVVEDLRTLADSTEARVAVAGQESGEQMQHLRIRAEDSLREARLRLLEAGARAEERIRHGARAADHYVHERPWHSLAMVASAAFLVGYILGRR